MFTTQEKSDIKKYYDQPLEELDQTAFEKKRKQLRAKYHPDNFEKYEDETVREMATERFQKLEALSNKMADFFSGKIPTAIPDPKSGDTPAYRHSSAVFAAKKLKFELITRDKDLKYTLFGRKYRWLIYGDDFKIPKTTATIVMDEDHRGNTIGYVETVRFYLTFGEEQKIEEIVDWFYPRIAEGVQKLLVDSEAVEINPSSILQAIQKVSFLRLN